MAQAQAAQYRLLVAPAVELVVRVGLCRSLAGLVHLPAEVCVCRVAPAALAAVVPSPSALPMAVQRVLEQKFGLDYKPENIHNKLFMVRQLRTDRCHKLVSISF